MGLLWSYFRDTLRLPFLAKPGPLAMLAQGGAECLDCTPVPVTFEGEPVTFEGEPVTWGTIATREIIALLRDQFLPSRCEDVYLERFAASRGIVQAPLEPEQYWQARIRFAYHWWARGGRESAMVEGLRLGFGFEAARVESLRGEDPAKWASFRVVLTGGPGDILLQVDRVRWAINEVKPARSLCRELKFYAPEQRVERVCGIAALSGTVTVIYPYTPTGIVLSEAHQWRGIACVGGTLSTIYPGDEE